MFKKLSIMSSKVEVFKMIGIIDVGGGLRGIFGAGVLDYCLDHHIDFDYCLGVSAGSANMVSYIAGQKGRNISFYTDYSFRKEYMSRHNFFKNGSYIDLDYVYSTLSNSDGENPLDYEAFAASKKQLRVAALNAETGKTHYFTKEDVTKDDYDIMKASCCIPMVCKPYYINDTPYFDGGIGNPIPMDVAFEDGCDKVVVILTRPLDYRKKSTKDELAVAALAKKYPEVSNSLQYRCELYNRQVDLAKVYQDEGKVLLVAPTSTEGLSTLTKDKDTLLKLYDDGYKKAEQILSFIAA